MSAQGIRLSTSAKADTSHELVTRVDRLPVDSINNDIARGKVPNAIPFNSFGQRVFSGSVTDQMVWSNGGFVGPAVGGVQMSVVSTSTDDASGGTGIRIIQVHYLDTEFTEKVETITLNGTTPVVMSATDVHFINTLHVVTFGSGKKAAGSITVYNGDNVYAEIQTGNNIQFSSAKMVPKGKVFYLAGAVSGSSSASSDARVTVKLVANIYDEIIFADPFIFLPYGLIELQDSTVTYNFPIPASFPAGVVVGLLATTDKACLVTGSLYGWIEDA
jgi:hypothetical protein|tara:strand:- start:1470 stop:2291 length:822 start_codon:yes stop_codon:yes gene_type:complete